MKQNKTEIFQEKIMHQRRHLSPSDEYEVSGSET
jgi:hypothetical protein